MVGGTAEIGGVVGGVATDEVTDDGETLVEDDVVDVEDDVVDDGE